MKSFQFLQKFTFKVKKTFSRNKIIWYAFYNKFAPLNRFWKIRFFSKNPTFFKKKPKIRQGCQNCILRVQKIFKFWKIFPIRERTPVRNENPIGKHRVRKTSDLDVLSGRFSSHIKNMTENNKKTQASRMLNISRQEFRTLKKKLDLSKFWKNWLIILKKRKMRIKLK